MLYLEATGFEVVANDFTVLHPAFVTRWTGEVTVQVSMSKPDGTSELYRINDKVRWK
jgi:hypothetical protein